MLNPRLELDRDVLSLTILRCEFPVNRIPSVPFPVVILPITIESTTSFVADDVPRLIPCPPLARAVFDEIVISLLLLATKIPSVPLPETVLPEIVWPVSAIPTMVEFPTSIPF